MELHTKVREDFSIINRGEGTYQGYLDYVKALDALPTISVASDCEIFPNPCLKLYCTTGAETFAQ